MKKISLLDLFCTLSVEEQSELIDASVAYARTVADPYTMEFYAAKKRETHCISKSQIFTIFRLNSKIIF